MARLPLFLSALWWGSQTALGLLVVPTLFAQLPTASLAGNLAARLFSQQNWLAAACAGLLLLWRSRSAHRQSEPTSAGVVWLLAGMLLAMLLEYAVMPRIVAREDLAFWHRVGTLLFGVQWLCAGWALWQCAAPVLPDVRSENAS